MRTHALLTALVLSGLTALHAPPARAIGVCEDLQVNYALIAAAPAAGLLAFEVKVEYCQELDTESTKAVLVTDLELGARRWFATPKAGAEAEAVRAAASGARLEKAEGWPALEKQRGFRPVAEVAVGGSCQVEAVALLGQRAVPLAKAPARHNFITHRLGVQLRVGDKAQPPLELGKHPHGAPAPGLWVLALPPPRGPRAYVSSARCVGGPPPGYAGSDSPGICYTRWQLSFKDVPLASAGACAAAPAAQR